MERIIVSESNDKKYLSYLYGKVSDKFSFLPADFSLEEEKDFSTLILQADKKYCPFIRKYAVENIADIIAIGYKYNYFKQKLSFPLLMEEEKDILLTSLVAADYLEDKEYITNILLNMNEYCINGLYNFRLNDLKKRWEKISEYVPPSFNNDSLKGFVDFLVQEGTGKIYLKDQIVYDEGYRTLTRSTLIGFNNSISEIILSGANKIYCFGKNDKNTINFLNKYYKNNTIYC